MVHCNVCAVLEIAQDDGTTNASDAARDHHSFPREQLRCLRSWSCYRRRPKTVLTWARHGLTFLCRVWGRRCMAGCCRNQDGERKGAKSVSMPRKLRGLRPCWLRKQAIIYVPLRAIGLGRY